MDHIRSIAERIAQDFVPPENPVTPSAEPQNRFGLGDPDCPICHGIGFVKREITNQNPSFETMVPCECRVRMFEHERDTNNKNNSNIRGYESMTFDTFNTKGNGFLRIDQQRCLEEALEFSLSFAEKPKGWLFFQGNYGSGKTHLAAAIANYLLSKGKTIIFQPVPDLLDQLRMSYGNRSETYEERVEKIRSVSVLFLDDLGAQNTTDWADEKLYQIFNYRYQNKMPTVITSNVNISRIEGRIASRLVDYNLTKNIEMNVPDYRRVPIGSGDNISILDYLSDRTFNNFDLRQNLGGDAARQLKMAYDKCKAFAYDTHGWLVLMGKSGIGKMHLAAAVGNECRKAGDQLFFVTAPDLLDHLRATYSPNSTTTYDAVFEQVRKCELLILNYLDTMNATPWAKEKIYQILNYRYQAKLPTLITMQKPIKDVDRNIQSRLIDNSLCTIVNMFSVPMFFSKPDEDIESLKASRYAKTN